ncbi:hypothetical protein D9M68_665070 [compost metagenome]
MAGGTTALAGCRKPVVIKQLSAQINDRSGRSRRACRGIKAQIISCFAEQVWCISHNSPVARLHEGDSMIDLVLVDTNTERIYILRHKNSAIKFIKISGILFEVLQCLLCRLVHLTGFGKHVQQLHCGAHRLSCFRNTVQCYRYIKTADTTGDKPVQVQLECIQYR